MSTQDNPSNQADPEVLRGRRILIVEDELLVALDTKALVWRFGGVVVGPFPRVPAALEAVRVHELDGAILDINVAGTQSFVVADALAARNIPIVFCTGYGRDIVPLRFKDTPIIEKPIIEQILVAAMVEAIAGAVTKDQVVRTDAR
jgi:CheY-like chemotaxis protein